MASRKPKGLGRGLDALLGSDGDVLKDLGQMTTENGLVEISLDALQAGKYQPRTQMEQEALQELADSIKAQGVIQPILIRKAPGRKLEEIYEIIAGERRVRAARLAGLNAIPAILREISDEQAALMALIENIQREDLNAIEEAQGIKRLLDEFSLTHDQAAQAIGRSRSATSNLLRLLSLADPVQKMLLAGDIDMGHARALLPLEPADQIQVANLVCAKKLSVRETEQIVKDMLAGPDEEKANSKAEPNQDLVRLETLLSDRLGTVVRIKSGKKAKGRIEVDFQDWEHLQGVLELLGFDGSVEEF